MAKIIAESLEQHRSRSASVLVIVLILALAILTMSGVGTTAILSLIGMAICAVCFFRREVRIDWWIFVPLAIYVAMNFISSYVIHDNPLCGYGRLHIIFLSVYAATCCLRDREMQLLRVLCIGWAAFAASCAIIAFTVQSFEIASTRLSFVIGTPNGLAIFLVLSWFALQSSCMSPKDNRPEKLLAIVRRFEPVILIALTMTLSIGSLCALAVGIIVMSISKARQTRSLSETLNFVTTILAKVFLCIVIGLLMYMSAERAQMPILCVVILLYIIVMICLWDRFTQFLNGNQKFSLVVSVVGLVCIPFAIFMRPNVFATFSERLAMVGNGIGYLGENPLVGVGAFNWRALNLQDVDMYYNTNHIHNAFIHTGVEFGWIAMIALIVIAIRLFIKHYKQAQHGEDAAFLFNMLTDTGFFYVGIVSTFILTAGGSTTPAKKITIIGTKLLFAALFAIHLIIFWSYIAMF